MAQRLIERACDRFRKEISQEDASEIVSTASIDDVKLALGQIERHLAARQSLRNFDRIAPFLSAAERLSQVVEVVCNGTPYLPWIWAPVKFIIQSARDHTHVLDKVLMAYANIGNNMPRLSRYGELFNDNAFQCMVAYLFEDILEFHRNAYSMLKKPGWTIFFSSSWGRFDHRFSSLLINIERLSEQIDREAVALDIMATAEWRSKNADDASKRDEQWQTQQLHATINWLGIEDDMQEAKLEMNASKCYDGTCHWLLKSGKIRTWLERKRGNPVLWLNGKPGSGKSILSSMLIRFLRSDPNRRVCFFFCDYNTSALDIGTQVLRTICSQIIRMAPDLVPYVYDECLGKAQRASSDVLRRIIPQLFARFDDVNLIVDGIDEIPSSEHRSLIITLLQLSKSCSGLKLLLVSQDLPTISTHLSKKPTLCLREESEATRKDHAIMVEGSLKELNDDRHGAIGDVLMEKLKKDILDKSEGMFLWIHLVMNLLRMSKSPQELRQQISSLPKTLADIYQKILNNICHQRTTGSAADVMRIFAWLKCHKGQQPMLKCEVRLGVALDGRTQRITRDSLPWADATDICKPLIEDGPGNTLVFVHSTVPQFLFESGPNSFMSVPEGIASVTFACVCQLDQALDLLQPRGPTSTSTIEVACGFYGLLPYSHKYWTQHLLEFLSLSEQVTTSLSSVIMGCLKQLCQKLIRMLDTDPVFTETDTTSLLLQKFLTVAEASIIMQMINRDEQSLSQGVEPGITSFDAPSASLQEYRRTVCYVSQQSSIPGVEQHDLIAFKEDYGPTAFVCDRKGCDRSLRGYPSENKLASHRARHAQSLRCYERDCSYNDVGFSTERRLKDHKRKMHHDPKMVPIPKRLHKSSPISMGELGPGQEYDPEEPPRSMYEQERRAQELDRESRDGMEEAQAIPEAPISEIDIWDHTSPHFNIGAIEAVFQSTLDMAGPTQQQQQPPPPQDMYEEPDRVRMYVDHLEQKQAERERQIDMRNRERREITSSDPSSDKTQKLPWQSPRKEAPQASSLHNPSHDGLPRGIPLTTLPPPSSMTTLMPEAPIPEIDIWDHMSPHFNIGAIEAVFQSTLDMAGPTYPSDLDENH